MNLRAGEQVSGIDGKPSVNDGPCQHLNSARQVLVHKINWDEGSCAVLLM